MKMEVEPSGSGKAESSAAQHHNAIMKNSPSELEEEVKEEPIKIKQVWFYKQCLYVLALFFERLHVYEVLDLSLKENTAWLISLRKCLPE